MSGSDQICQCDKPTHLPALSAASNAMMSTWNNLVFIFTDFFSSNVQITDSGDIVCSARNAVRLEEGKMC